MRSLRSLPLPAVLSFGCSAAALFTMMTSPSPAHAEGSWITEFPLVVYCEFNGVGSVYYLSEVGTDKVAIYLTPDRQAGTITIDGTARTVGGERSGTCKGKTIEDLRAAGQAFDAMGKGD